MERKPVKTARTVAKSPVGRGAQDEVSMDPELVKMEAYKICEERGCAHGADLSDWLEAEKALRNRATAGKSRATL
jgi:hypothetical protein